MPDQTPPSASIRSRAGQVLTRWGLILCGVAMVIGFFIALGLHLFDDPEEPAAIYGKLFAAVLLLFAGGVVIAVVGALIPKPARLPPQVRRASRDMDAPGESIDATDPVAGQVDHPEAIPGMKKKTWDEAYATPHRRR